MDPGAPLRYGQDDGVVLSIKSMLQIRLIHLPSLIVIFGKALLDKSYFAKIAS
ncbi:hypothetical protein SAMN05216304_101947 [Bosea sp. OK403]|nr:hypothetical protein SAMN05216304_101947 [Bosea sp. OK403]